VRDAGGRPTSGPAAGAPDTEEHGKPVALWLVDLLAGATAAEDAGHEYVRDARTRRLAAIVDMSVASAATPGGLEVPDKRRFEELLALPVEVWIDDRHLRRIRLASDMFAETLELWDVGGDLGGFDWSRLPDAKAGRCRGS